MMEKSNFYFYLWILLIMPLCVLSDVHKAHIVRITKMGSVLQKCQTRRMACFSIYWGHSSRYFMFFTTRLQVSACKSSCKRCGHEQPWLLAKAVNTALRPQLVFPLVQTCLSQEYGPGTCSISSKTAVLKKKKKCKFLAGSTEDLQTQDLWRWLENCCFS